MVATPFKTFTKVHIIQQPIHLTLSQKYRKRLFLLGPRHFPQRIYRDLASPQKEFIVNEAKDMEWLISQGVDFITTNEPVVLEEILKKK